MDGPWASNPKRRDRYSRHAPIQCSVRLPARILGLHPRGAGAAPARSAIMAGSFNGRTAGFESAYEGSIPSPASKYSRSSVGPQLLLIRVVCQDRHLRAGPELCHLCSMAMSSPAVNREQPVRFRQVVRGCKIAVVGRSPKPCSPGAEPGTRAKF